ncbi:PaaI family thioesterase [Sciscionella marina]|uniref:PaaI family thioesterase n=1 Tax=Sciscionella marina TaxID=508770 RepID=UPI000371A5EA|nr:PaaI family thioesterase [Sciscionella marina]
MDQIDAQATEALHQLIPFAGHLGIEVIVNTPEQVRAQLPWQERLCTAGGIFHGGALMALADTVGAMCAMTNIETRSPGSGTATVESKTNFLRPGKSANATARTLHTGKRFVVVETEIRDDDGKLVAKVTQTQAVL